MFTFCRDAWGKKRGKTRLEGKRRGKTRLQGTKRGKTRLQGSAGAGTDEILFRLVPVPGHGARVLPLELVAVPGHGAQISAQAPTKTYVQTGARARAPSLNRALLRRFASNQSRLLSECLISKQKRYN